MSDDQAAGVNTPADKGRQTDDLLIVRGDIIRVCRASRRLHQHIEPPLNPLQLRDMAPERSLGSDEWRIVLIGKTGAGKSSAGNTILGREAFESELSPTSLTAECKKVRGVIGGRHVAVIDTPGLYDTVLSNEEVWGEIKKCIGMSSPGPHAILVIVQLGRFTDEERHTVEMIQETFGDDADRYMMVLFTYGDRLKKQTIQEFISKSKDLRNITEKCYNRYHVFNNNSDDPSQISQLLEKIEKMVRDNGGLHYTTEMFQKAEEEIEKEKERILRETEAERKKEEEELKAKYEGEMLKIQEELNRVRAEREAAARAEAERQNAVHQPPRRRCVIL